MKILSSTSFPGLKLLKQGKVRDVYDLDDKYLIVVTDRISAYDVVMNEPAPYRGVMLNKISAFWFRRTEGIVSNHLINDEVDDYPSYLKRYAKDLEGRSMIVIKCKPVPVECVVRGYLAGSGWKEYKETGMVGGHKLPAGLREFEKLPEPLFTPSTKAEEGHDINITFSDVIDITGGDVAINLRDLSLELYKYGAKYMEDRGIILADTKFEFGHDPNGELILIDEAMTPDSSRFWLKEDYAPGVEQTNFDKQVLRDYLSGLDWGKQPPPPPLPEHVLQSVSEKYSEAYYRITGERFKIKERKEG